MYPCPVALRLFRYSVRNGRHGTGVLQVSICDGGSGDVQVTVTENGGRNKGNTAVWEITCTAELTGSQ